MGIIIIGAFLVALIGGLVPGIGGLLFFWWLHDQKGRGTWPRYILFACVGGLALVGVGVLQFPPEPSGAPTGEYYFGSTTALFLIGLAPGGGLLAGCLAALAKRGGDSGPS